MAIWPSSLRINPSFRTPGASWIIVNAKKSIPSSLKRKINTLAALFELADREFRQVRDATLAEIEKAETEYGEVGAAPVAAADVQSAAEVEPGQYAQLNAFRFLKIAKHFFPDFEFEAHKVDGFTSEIVQLKPDISRGKFNFYMKDNIANVKKYQAELEKANPNDTFNAYTIIRHCLLAGNSQVFASMLTNTARTPSKSGRPSVSALWPLRATKLERHDQISWR